MRKNRDTETFSLSFLDAITCAFGAVILLLVLTKIYEPQTIERAKESMVALIAALQAELFELRGETAVMNRLLSGVDEQLSESKERLARLQGEVSNIRGQYDASKDDALVDIRTRAAAHGAPIFVHAMGADEYARALQLEPAAFVHGGFMESTPTVEILRDVKESGAAVITTLAILDMTLLVYQTERMEDPWFRMLVPEEQLAAAANDEYTHEMLTTIFDENLPGWVPRALIRLLVPFLSGAQTSDQLASSMFAVKATAHGVEGLVGADVGHVIPPPHDAIRIRGSQKKTRPAGRSRI